MSLVLACAQQHDGGNPRRESGHGARSLDGVRPIAPVAHRTERSAPDRKAAGSIPDRRTTTRIENAAGTRLTASKKGPPAHSRLTDFSEAKEINSAGTEAAQAQAGP